MPDEALRQFEEALAVEVIFNSFFSERAAEGRGPTQVLSAGYPARHTYSVQTLRFGGGVGAVERKGLLQCLEDVREDWTLGSLCIPTLTDQSLKVNITQL
ncbi:hypothetical protein Pmani_017526 [Petrolisthes manimaculis]|uniref:Uncharacterized protein n=1 Tax=Petrolisthes manimaculis TaxID=1843537 RepID=A0AAE1PLP9_9EUCA|nr:hypothetical protein Pmani_017526 [Petrolisthes manimaculis]